MVSPTALLNRIGVGGQLVPFFKCVCVYFVGMAASGGDAPEPSPAAVAAKCAPVLCLLLVVLLHHSMVPYHKGGYLRLVGAGLALSALGDALLVWERGLTGGMAAFGAAHVCYAAAFAGRGRGGGGAAGGAAWAAGAALYAGAVRAPVAGGAGVPLYALALAGMAWRAAAAPPPAPAAALLFLVSDAMLGYSLFVGPLPYKQPLVMSTYYLAQLGIALSAVRPLPADDIDPASTPAPAHPPPPVPESVLS